MNPEKVRDWLESVASDLRSRKLLPVLVLLIAAAVAIPLLLSHSGKAASVSPLPPAPVVTVPVPKEASETGTTHRHEASQNYLTGPSHNPFVTKTSTTTTPSATASTGAGSPGSTSTSASSVSTTAASSQTSKGSSGSTAPKTVTVSAPSATKTVSKTTTVPAKLPYANYEVEASLLQTGIGGTPTVFHNLSRDQLLPSDTGSFAAFLGVRTDKNTAVFVLTDDTTVTGAGQCAPSATACTFLTLKPGQAVTVVVQPSAGAAATYTLSYLKVLKVASNASTVAIDQTGATDVKQATSYIPELKTIQYAHYTGLLSIDLGSTVPVTP